MSFNRKQLTEIKEIIQVTIRELLNDSDFLNNIALKIAEELKIPEVIDKKCKHFEDEITVLRNQNKTLNAKLDNLEQYTRRNNIRIYGVAEDSTSQEDTIRTLRKHTKLNFTEENIESAYRMGKVTGSGHRAIFVKFKSQQCKQVIMMNRGTLKGTIIIICDDLTKAKHEVLKEAVSTLGKRNIYSLGGKVYFRRGSTKVMINNMEDIEKHTAQNQ